MSRKQASKGKDLAAFRELHDKSLIIPKKIRVGLAALGSAWEYEGDFIQRCQVSQPEFAKYRDQFADFFVEVRASGKQAKRAWAGTKKYADRLRATVNI